MKVVKIWVFHMKIFFYIQIILILRWAFLGFRWPIVVFLTLLSAILVVIFLLFVKLLIILYIEYCLFIANSIIFLNFCHLHLHLFIIICLVVLVVVNVAVVLICLVKQVIL